METKLKNLTRVILSEAEKSKIKVYYDSKTFEMFEYKEVMVNLPLEVIEELSDWVKVDE